MGELCPFWEGGAGSPCNTMRPGPRPTFVPSATLIHPAVWPQQTWVQFFGAGGKLGPHLTQCHLGQGLPFYQVASWSIEPFGHNRYWPKIGGCAPFGGGGPGSPSNTVWSGPRPTCVPSFILIRPTVWLQYTNITDRQDRQTDRTDNGLIA